MKAESSRLIPTESLQQANPEFLLLLNKLEYSEEFECWSDFQDNRSACVSAALTHVTFYRRLYFLHNDQLHEGGDDQANENRQAGVNPGL